MHKALHRLTLTTALLIASTLNVAAAQSAKPPSAEQTRAEITTLLNDFLKPGSNDKAETHERFWADDLVYTSAMGVVRSKADILKSFKPSDAKPAAGSTTAAPAAPTVFSAEDIVVRPYGANGDVAALTFRLVATEADGKKTYYRNSGTFLWRGGKWQAVTWQATKVADTQKN
ncbi:MAG: nuclear transport factor 2 family protein [Betaproteobacteria bacterium]|nr:nuclear transport factor 2 family protein [Betaproteobacteria bacterium]